MKTRRKKISSRRRKKISSTRRKKISSRRRKKNMKKKRIKRNTKRRYNKKMIGSGQLTSEQFGESFTTNDLFNNTNPSGGIVGFDNFINNILPEICPSNIKLYDPWRQKDILEQIYTHYKGQMKNKMRVVFQSLLQEALKLQRQTDEEWVSTDKFSNDLNRLIHELINYEIGLKDQKVRSGQSMYYLDCLEKSVNVLNDHIIEIHLQHLPNGKVEEGYTNIYNLLDNIQSITIKPRCCYVPLPLVPLPLVPQRDEGGSIIIFSGPQASGKTHFSQNPSFIKLITDFFRLTSDLFCFYDGGDFREYSISYQLIKNVALALGYNGFSNLTPSGLKHELARREMPGVQNALFDTDRIKPTFAELLNKINNKCNIIVTDTLNSSGKAEKVYGSFPHIDNKYIVHVYQHFDENKCIKINGSMPCCLTTKKSGENREAKEGKKYSGRPETWKHSHNHGLEMILKNLEQGIGSIIIHNSGGPGVQSNVEGGVVGRFGRSFIFFVIPFLKTGTDYNTIIQNAGETLQELNMIKVAIIPKGTGKDAEAFNRALNTMIEIGEDKKTSVQINGNNVTFSVSHI